MIRTGLASKGRLRARRRLRPISARRRAGHADWNAVYAEVDARSGGFCEVALWYRRQTDGHDYQSRCTKKAEDHHHTVKPRAANHASAKIIHICRNHHRMADNPFSAGRLIILALGAGAFHCRIVTAESKVEARAKGLIP